MHRRRFLGALAVGSLAALAGCSGPNGSLRLTTMDDDGGLAERYATQADELPDELGDFLVSVIEDEPRSWEDTSPPYERDRPVEHERAYYRLDHEIVDTRTETIYVIEIDYDPEGAVDGSTIDHDDLPSVDRAAVADLFPPPEEPPTGEGFDLGRGHRYGSEDEADSVLVPESEYDAVTYEGSAYPIRTERGRDVDVHTYEYTAERVATDAADLAASVRDRYRFTLEGLSADERDIVEAAIDDSYRVESDDNPPAAFESLLDRFRAHEAIHRDEHNGDWLVRYDGHDYWAGVGFPYDGTSGEGTDSVTPPAVTPPPE